MKSRLPGLRRFRIIQTVIIGWHVLSGYPVASGSFYYFNGMGLEGGVDFEFFPYLIFIALAGLIFWHGWDVKKRATSLATEYCEQNSLQLLDQSVVLESIRPLRGRDGRLVFRRVFRFEFASTGDARYQGSVVLLGMKLESVQLEPWRLQ